MDSIRGNTKPLNANRTKLPTTRSPKMMPSYIVAFAMHETYDDIETAQQMICNKRSLEDSYQSVSSTLSTKTITLNQNSTNNLEDTDPEGKNETKITIDEAGLDYDIASSLKSIEQTITDDYIKITRKSDSLEKLAHLVSKNCNNTAFETFDCGLDVKDKQENKDETNDVKPNTTSIDKVRISRNPNKMREDRKIVKNTHYKDKKALKTNNKRCANIIKDVISTYSLGHVISRSKLPKKNKTKENSHEQEDYVLSSQTNFDEDSLQSIPLTIKGSFVSNSSKNTIKQVSCSSLRNEVSYISDKKTSLENSLPYGKDIVNVSVAVTYKPSTVKINEEYNPLAADNLIRIDTVTFPSNITASGSAESSDRETCLQNKPSISPSDKTLTFDKKYSDLNSVSTNSTFVVGNTCSRLDTITMNSDDTLAPNSETFMYSEYLRPLNSVFDSPELDKKYNRTLLLDTVIGMGLLPEMNASTSSAIYYNDNYNKVYVTGDSNKLSQNTKDQEDTIENQEKKKSVLKKTFENINESNKHNNLTLPNESSLKAEFNNSDKYCSGESGTYPKNLNELWDRLASVVDKAVRRLEDSLIEKLITEMRKSFSVIESNVNTLTQGKIILGNQIGNDIFFSNKGVIVEAENISQSQSLQCSLVGNQIIDNIMLKLSRESQKLEIPMPYCKSLQKVKEPNILKDCIEILKPHDDKLLADTNKGDIAALSTAVASELETSGSYVRVKSLFIGPLTFVRENIAILASVPAFFIGLLCIYVMIVFIMKLW